MKVAIVTFGCKINQYESEYMAERLERAGHLVVPPQFKADVYVINSCAVTKTAERKVQNRIRRIKRDNPSAKVVVVGCYPQLKPQDPTEYGADLSLGNKEKKEIEKYIDFLGFFVKKAYWLDDSVSEVVESGYSNMKRAYVKVEDGCDRSCTYCAIRFARGSKIRSKPVELVKEEVKNLVERGYLEIVVTGINLGRYGVDTGEKLYDLIKALNDLEGDFRIRLSSMNPEDVDEKVYEMFRDFDRLVNHLHLSVQNGSNRILKRMGRGYTVEDYLKVVENLRKIDPIFSITTDIIVGFPGETEIDFNQTVKLVEEVLFSKVHIFRFSPREGTLAAKMSGRVPGDLKKRRANDLESVSKKVSEGYKRLLLGKKLKVLIERTENGISFGHDEYYVLHEFSGGEEGSMEEVIALSITDEGVVSKIADRCKRKAI